VIGYGNVLRGDDGLGPRVAEAVAGWALPGVLAVAVPQLVPELAERLAAARLAVFVDACRAPEHNGVQVRRLEPANVPPTLGHTSAPEALLALALAAYGRSPPAWAVTVPARDLGMGEGLSAATEHGLEAALVQVSRLLGERKGGACGGAA
jgi:hydrogenase maturation protease